MKHDWHLRREPLFARPDVRGGREAGPTAMQEQERFVDEGSGWRAEEAARGAMRAIEEALDDGLLVERAASAGARGVLVELRAELGAEGQGPLSQSMSAAARRATRDAVSGLVTPAALLAVAVFFGVASAVALRRASLR
jgi:hypothetical protein